MNKQSTMNTSNTSILSFGQQSRIHETYGSRVYPENVTGYPMRESRYDVDLPGSAIKNEGNTAILVVNSYDRDKSKYPNANKYTIQLQTEYRDVVGVELTSASFPNSGYIVDQNNNLLHFQDTTTDINSDNVRVAEIEPGDWPLTGAGTTLSDKIKEALDLASDDNTYTVTVDIPRKKFTISQDGGGTGVFQLIFEGMPMHYDAMRNVTDVFYIDRSIGRLIGFDRRNKEGAISYTSNLTYDLRPDSFLVLRIRNLERMESVNHTVDRGFAIISQDKSFNNFQFAKDTDGISNHRYVKYFISPIHRLTEFDIEIRTLDGKLYDFNGHDHYMTFEIQTLTRVDSYTSRINRMRTLRQ